MMTACDVVATHRVRQWQINLAFRAYPLWSKFQCPDFSRAKVLDHFRAGIGGCAASQNASRRQAPDRIRMRQPPLRPFATSLVEFEYAIGLCPAEIQRDAATRNNWPNAIVHHAALLSLIES